MQEYLVKKITLEDLYGIPNNTLEELFATQYKLYFLFSPVNTDPIWMHSQWSQFSHILREQSKIARKPVSVRSKQRVPENQIEEIKFGRLGLTEKSDEKWCVKEQHNGFRETIISVPSGKKCLAERIAPQLIVKVMNKGQYLNMNFSCVLILAFSQQTNLNSDELLHSFDETSLFMKAKAIMNPFLSGTKVMPWKVPSENNTFLSATLESMWWFDLFPQGLPEEQRPTRELLENYWDSIDTFDLDRA